MAQIARLTAQQFTGGSSSTADLHETLRRAGAVARETLKLAAAKRYRFAVDRIETADGAAILPDGTRIPYADLAAEAAAIDPVAEVTLRAPTAWRRLGGPMRRTDIMAKSGGTQIYGVDLRLEGMLHATVRRNPAVGGAMRGYDASAAQAMRGVHAVVPVTGGVGVLADNTWRAFRAAEAIEIDWAAPGYPATSAEMWAALEGAHSPDRRNSRLRDDGDVDGALYQGDVLKAEYRTPYLAHAPLEPISATVLYRPDHMEIWTATQIPHVVRDRAAAAAGLDPDAVTLHVLPAGGSFGRRLDATTSCPPSIWRAPFPAGPSR